MLAPRATIFFLGLLLLFSTVTLAGAPNPTAGVSAVAIDAGRVVSDNETKFGQGVLQDSPVLEGPSPVFDVRDDLTIANATYNGSQSTVLLCEAGNGVVIAQATLYHPSNTLATWNATFPNVQLNATGLWSVNDVDCGANSGGVTLARFFVQPALDAPVTLSTTTLALGTTQTLGVHVNDTFGNPVPNAVVTILISGCWCDASQDFGATSTQLYGNGTAGNGQNGDYAFTLTPQRGLYYDVLGGAGAHFGVSQFHVLAATSFSLPDVRGSLLAPVPADITMSNATDFGTATLTVQLDTTVVQLAGVTPGNIPGAMTTWNWDNASSTLTILVTTNGTPGPSGSFVFANLSLQAVGTPGATTGLGIGIVEAAHSDGTNMPASAFAGTFHAGLIGDANGDGHVDQNDVVAIAQYVVGAPVNGTFVPQLADVNHDGRVTGVDAMMVRQFLAGTRVSLS